MSTHEANRDHVVKKENTIRLRPTPMLCLDTNNLAKTWKVWKEEFQLYVDLVQADAEEKVKAKLFLYPIGERGRELCETLTSSTPAADHTLGLLINAFDEYCNPKLNETVERYRFFVRNKGPDENLDQYVTDLRVLASTFNFGEIKYTLIRDRIVCGSIFSQVRERLLRQDKLNFKSCIQVCRATE